MPSLRCLFIVQGEGRGHLTQALALRALLARAGHEVAGVVVGQHGRRTVPAFFEEKIDAPVHYVRSPGFVRDAMRRGVRPGATLWAALRQAVGLRGRLDALDASLQRSRPDVVVNFFEPMAGLYYGLRRPKPPMVSIAHQYMFLHPAYRFPKGWPVSRRVAQGFARLTAWGSARRLALSLYPAPDRPAARLTVMPPLLRPQVFALEPTRAPFILMYLLNRGYMPDVIRWHEAHPDVRLHCFVDRPEAPAADAYDATLTFHRVDDQKFLSMMARCRGVVCTAGFESVAEALYLGKPVQVMPVDGHFEQHCNAHDTVRAGAGCRSAHFDVDLLLQAARDYRPPGVALRRWVEEGQRRFVQAIEAAAGLPHAQDGSPVCEGAAAKTPCTSANRRVDTPCAP